MLMPAINVKCSKCDVMAEHEFILPPKGWFYIYSSSQLLYALCDKHELNLTHIK